MQLKSDEILYNSRMEPLTMSGKLVPVRVIHQVVVELLAVGRGHPPGAVRYLIQSGPNGFYDVSHLDSCAWEEVGGESRITLALMSVNVKLVDPSGNLQSVRYGEVRTSGHASQEMNPVEAPYVIEDEEHLKPNAKSHDLTQDVIHVPLSMVYG